jgi:hypothetical protein
VFKSIENDDTIESSSDESDSDIELSQTENINGSPNSIENVEGENYTDETQSRKEPHNENNRRMRKVSDLQNQRRKKIKGTFEYQDKASPAKRSISGPPMNVTRGMNSKISLPKTNVAYAARLPQQSWTRVGTRP